jgi:ferrous-iron efflux pump FieF
VQENTLKKFATISAVSVAIILISIKFIAWYISNSVSVLSSLVDSCVDMLASIVNLIAVYHAMKPADTNHRFGHGKVEAIAAMGQSLFILGSALFIIWEAFERFLDPQPIKQPQVAMMVTFAAILLTIILVSIQKYTIKRTKSLAIQADMIHYQSDLYLNAGVLVTLFLTSYYDIPYLDPVFGFFVGLYIIRTAFKIMKEAFFILIDRELSQEKRQKIIKIIMANKQVKGYHLLRTRSSGHGEFIQCHLEMEGDISLYKAHIIATEVEEALHKKFPLADITLHQDPAEIKEEHRKKFSE